MIIKSVEPLSVGKIQGCLGALFGLIAGGFITLLSMVGAMGGGRDGGAGIMMGVGAIIIIPIVYGIAGFIGGLIGGVLYNVVAGIVGGIELEIERGPSAGGGGSNPFQQ